MTIELVWPDGCLTRGESWREIEDAIRAMQMRRYDSRHAFREEMRFRAREWSGESVGSGAPWTSEAFIRQLADRGLFILHIT